MPVQLMNSTLIPLCTHLGERLGVPIGDAFLPAAGRRSSGKCAKFLAYLACWDDSAPYVARGLLQILQPKDSQFLDADGRKLFTDRLSKGKSDPTACPEVRGFTFGRPFQADAHVSLIDLVGDSCRGTAMNQPASERAPAEVRVRPDAGSTVHSCGRRSRACDESSRPILLGFVFHSRRIRVLHFEPIGANGPGI